MFHPMPLPLPTLRLRGTGQGESLDVILRRCTDAPSVPRDQCELCAGPAPCVIHVFDAYLRRTIQIIGNLESVVQTTLPLLVTSSGRLTDLRAVKDKPVMGKTAVYITFDDETKARDALGLLGDTIVAPFPIGDAEARFSFAQLYPLYNVIGLKEGTGTLHLFRLLTMEAEPRLYFTGPNAKPKRTIFAQGGEREMMMITSRADFWALATDTASEFRLVRVVNMRELFVFLTFRTIEEAERAMNRGSPNTPKSKLQERNDEIWGLCTVQMFPVKNGTVCQVYKDTSPILENDLPALRQDLKELAESLRDLPPDIKAPVTSSNDSGTASNSIIVGEEVKPSMNGSFLNDPSTNGAPKMNVDGASANGVATDGASTNVDGGLADSLKTLALEEPSTNGNSMNDGGALGNNLSTLVLEGPSTDVPSTAASPQASSGDPDPRASDLNDESLVDEALREPSPIATTPQTRLARRRKADEEKTVKDVDDAPIPTPRRARLAMRRRAEDDQTTVDGEDRTTTGIRQDNPTTDVDDRPSSTPPHTRLAKRRQLEDVKSTPDVEDSPSSTPPQTRPAMQRNAQEEKIAEDVNDTPTPIPRQTRSAKRRKAEDDRVTVDGDDRSSVVPRETRSAKRRKALDGNATPDVEDLTPSVPTQIRQTRRRKAAEIKATTEVEDLSLSTEASTVNSELDLTQLPQVTRSQGQEEGRNETATHLTPAEKLDASPAASNPQVPNSQQPFREESSFTQAATMIASPPKGDLGPKDDVQPYSSALKRVGSLDPDRSLSGIEVTARVQDEVFRLALDVSLSTTRRMLEDRDIKWTPDVAARAVAYSEAIIRRKLDTEQLKETMSLATRLKDAEERLASREAEPSSRSGLVDRE